MSRSFMVQALINISEKANRILNIIKAKHGLRDKSEAINKMAEEYELHILEPELQPEYIEKLKKIDEERAVKVESFAERYGRE